MPWHGRFRWQPVDARRSPIVVNLSGRGDKDLDVVGGAR